MKFITPKHRFRITPEDLNAILESCESTCSYWINYAIRHEDKKWWYTNITHNNNVIIVHGEELGRREYESLDTSKVLHGIDLYLDVYPEFLETGKWNLATYGDTNELLQFALFGELRYN